MTMDLGRRDGIAAGTEPGSVRVTFDGGGDFRLDIAEIPSRQTETFREGQPTVLDVLLLLADRGDIDLSLRFDESLGTRVIESLNGHDIWWYEVHYDLGWFEANVMRMDDYPLKGGSRVHFKKTTASHLERILATFREEVARLDAAGGTVIIPEVTIRGPRWSVSFEDVIVTAHDTRADILQPGVITALDILLSLGEQGLLSELGLTWYESVGAAVPVGNYFVERIETEEHGAEAYGSCGLVYEVGPKTFNGFKGSHVHITTDVRVIVSPEYALWFWICL